AVLQHQEGHEGEAATAAAVGEAGGVVSKSASARTANPTVADRFLVACSALQRGPDETASAVFGQDQRPVGERGVVPQVLPMTAVEQGDPVAFVVLGEPGDGASHRGAVTESR